MSAKTSIPVLASAGGNVKPRGSSEGRLACLNTQETEQDGVRTSDQDLGEDAVTASGSGRQDRAGWPRSNLFVL